MPSSKALRPVAGVLGLWLLLHLGGCAMPPEQRAYRQRLEAGIQTPQDVVRFKSGAEEQRRLVAGAPEWPAHIPYGAEEKLMRAASAGDLAGIKAAVASGARVNASDRWGATPLQLAAQHGQVESVRALLRAGASANGRGGAMTPLAAAALGGHTEVVTLLLRSGAHADTSTEAGEPALVHAVRMNHLAAADALLQAGASLTVRNRQGYGPCMLAITENLPDMLALLLRHGANPNAPDADGLTPLYWAEYFQRDALVPLLVQAGANPQVRKIALPASAPYAFGEL